MKSTLVAATAILITALPPSHAIAQAAAPGIIDGPLATRADSLLVASVADGFSGVALVRRGSEIILLRGYGAADRANGAAMRTNSVVQIGSNTKDFTQVAILQLFASATLGLDDSLPKYFANVPIDKRGITIRQLLTHTAGLPSEIGPDFEPIARDVFLARVMGTTLLSAPGSRARYSNAGYSVLAAIIETVTGASYDRYVRDSITGPLGLHDTGFLFPNFDHARLAHGYEGTTDRGTMLDHAHASDGPWWNLRGNGGMLSTVPDMAEFYRVLYETETLLKPAVRRVMFGDGPVVLAGSDRVNYFIYDREPAGKLEILLASTSTAVPAPQILPQMQRIFRPGGAQPGARQGKVTPLPDTPVAATIRGYVTAFNSGDTTTMRAFLRDHFAPMPGDTRTINDRLVSYTQLSANLGTLTIAGGRPGDAGVLEVSMKSTREDQPVTFEFTIENSAPFRIRSLRIRVGD